MLINFGNYLWFTSSFKDSKFCFFFILRLCTVFCLGNSKFICNELFSLFGVDICFLSEPFSIRRTYKFHHVIFDFQKSVTIYTWINLDVFVNTKLTFPWTFFLNDVNFFLNSTWSFFLNDFLNYTWTLFRNEVNFFPNEVSFFSEPHINFFPNFFF